MESEYTGAYIATVALIIMFWGSPDLHDALIAKLMQPEAGTQISEANAEKEPVTKRLRYNADTGAFTELPKVSGQE